MSIESEPRPATEKDLWDLLQSLADHQVDYVLIGGQALALHGFARGTEDIDLLLPIDSVNGQQVIDAFSILPDKAAKEVEPEWLAEEGTVRVADEIVVDLMTVAANGETYESLKPHIQRQEKDGFGYYLLDVEGLIKTKQSVRPKDQQDLLVLRKMLDRQRSLRIPKKEPKKEAKKDRSDPGIGI